MNNEKDIRVVARANQLEEVAGEVSLLMGSGYKDEIGFEVDYDTSTIGNDNKPLAYISPLYGGPGDVSSFSVSQENVVKFICGEDGISRFQTRNYEYLVRFSKP